MSIVDNYEVDLLSSIYKSIQSKPITIPAHAKLNLCDREKKPHIVDIPMADIPTAEPSTSGSVPSELKFIVKNIKTSQKVDISSQSTSSIKDIKQAVVDAHLADSIDAQRLLLKGKALLNDKLVKDYEGLTSGATLTLMLRAPSAPPTEPASRQASNLPEVSLTSADNDSTRTAADPAIDSQSVKKSDYDNTLTDPAFWKKLNVFLNQEFKNDEYGRRALETFFLSAKTSLSPSEIALIREQAGFEAMGKQE